MQLDFNCDWKAYTTPEPEQWHLPRTAREVRLPHDDNIRFDTAGDNPSGPAGAYYPGCSVEYEKELLLPAEWRSKRVSLAFDGVYHNAVVRVNYRFVHRAHYGYTAFQCDLTPFLREGTNLIRVSAANRDVPGSRWYTGTGIYRDVTLLVQEKVFLPWRSAALTTAVDREDALVTALIPVRNETDAHARRKVCFALRSPSGRETTAQTEIDIPAWGETQAELQLRVESPLWWSPDTPNLYNACIRLLSDGQEQEESVFDFGLRTLAVSPEKGFELNGKTIKLRGGCIHHDNGILGAASYLKAEERKIRALKQCGYNAIRSAHNPASEALLRACDRLGMLVMDEAFDMWREPKMPYDNSQVFEFTWQQDLEAMVARDRNHACVVFYCTGNEVPERDGHSGGNRISRELADTLRRLDPSRPVTHALCNVSADGEVNGIEANLSQERDVFASATEAFAAPLDVVGYNYMRDRLERDHRLYPQRVLCASETAPGDILRGWDEVERLPWVIGDFVWTAVDYLGEVGIGRAEVDGEVRGLADYPYRVSGCGDLDLCLRRKNRSYYRDCVWGIAKRPWIGVEHPRLHDRKKHMLWWGWPMLEEEWHFEGFEGSLCRVCVYSAAPEVALFLNGLEIGRSPAGKAMAYKADFEICYEPGTLEAVEYYEGKPGASWTLHTPGAGRALRVSADKTSLCVGEDDLLFADIQLTDGEGLPVYDSDLTVQLEVSGGAELLAAGSAAIRTRTNYTSPIQQLWRGHAQAVLRVRPQNGEIALLRVRCRGLADSLLSIRIEP